MVSKKGTYSNLFALYNNGTYGFRIRLPNENRLEQFAVGKWLKDGAEIDLYRKKVGVSVTCRGKGRIKISPTGMMKSELSRSMPKGWYKAKVFKEQIYFEFVGNNRYARKRYGF